MVAANRIENKPTSRSGWPLIHIAWTGSSGPKSRGRVDSDLTGGANFEPTGGGGLYIRARYTPALSHHVKGISLLTDGGCSKAIIRDGFQPSRGHKGQGNWWNDVDHAGRPSGISGAVVGKPLDQKYAERFSSMAIRAEHAMAPSSRE